MPNEMIERVAKAMFDEFCPAIRYSDADKIWYQQAAKIAIAAMREPTEEMLIAGHCTTASDHLEMGYQAMIDAALKED